MGRRKTGRQATFSSDILYDTLQKYDPAHLMLAITREEALRGLVDFGRIEDMFTRIQGRIDTVRLEPHHARSRPRCSSRWAASRSKGAGRERLMAEAADRLMTAAGLA